MGGFMTGGGADPFVKAVKNVAGVSSGPTKKLDTLLGPDALLNQLGVPRQKDQLAALAARSAGLSERNKQLSNNGRRSSFLTGNLGAAPIELKTLLGQ